MQVASTCMGAQAVLDEAHEEEEEDFDDVSASRTISTSWMIGEPMSFLSYVIDVKSEADIELDAWLSCLLIRLCF